MRSLVPAAAAWLLAASTVLAQEPDAPMAPGPTPPTAGAATSPTAAPSAPIPYTALAEKQAAPKPHPTVKPVQPVGAQLVAPPAPGARAPAAEPRLQPGQGIPSAELERFVDGVVKAAMARDHIAGVTVAVVQNGQILLKKGYGFASLTPQQPVDPDRTLFRLGSLSKTFTWIGLMKAVEAGRMRLDQPVNLYLPERLQIRDQGFDQPVRVIDLMSHTAGFEDRAFGRLFESDPDYVRPLDLYLRQERPRRVRAPGEVASYSNYGAALAGEAESWTAGKPFERLMEDEIFLPLGMSRTTFRERRPAKAALPAPMPEAMAANVADGFHWSAGGFEVRPYEYIGQIAPAGAASSTAGDMARYMLALLGGGQLGGVSIYGARTAQAFRTPILATPAGINGWAHGFMVEPLPGGRTGYGHPGAALSFAANLVTAPDLNLGVFVAVNTDSGRELPETLPAAIVREFYTAPESFPRPSAPDLARAAARYEGRFLSTRRAHAGLEGFFGRIIGAARVKVTPEGRLITYQAGQPRVWVPEGAPGEGRFAALQGDERLAFRIAGGEGTAFQDSANTQLFERISFWRSPDALLLFAGLGGAAAALTLIGAALRGRRELRESAVQSRAALIQNIQAALWLMAMTFFGLWLIRWRSDPARLAFGWPGAALITASACGLVAAALTATTLVALPAVWRGGRRVDSWPVPRRASFTVTVIVYTALSVLLALAGALSPWSG